MRRLTFIIIFAITLSACTRPARPGPISTPAGSSLNPQPRQTTTPSPLITYLPPTRAPGAPILTPTPDTARTLPAVPTAQVNPGEYVVQSGDTLGTIAVQFNLTTDQMVAANPDINPDFLFVGQTLKIPGVDDVIRAVVANGSSFKIIPDSELVNGPAAALFDIDAFIRSKNGYLAAYAEDVDGELLTGAQIVARVAREYSVNPRLLLSVLEYQSNWVTVPSPASAGSGFPIHYGDEFNPGLYRQLARSADALNHGFYKFQEQRVSSWVLADNLAVPIDPGLNAGTAGVQHFFALIDSLDQWRHDVSLGGLFSTYFLMFGYPFDLAVEPLLPQNISQPTLQLPLPNGEAWYFTGGPHGGWGGGSAYAALDFAPPGEPLGCVTSVNWAVAVADGLVMRSETGIVVQDLDGDGYEQTGWTVLYLHMATEGRVPVGTYLKAGDHIGHPSCEGGYSPLAAHLHIARRYNGMWIAADGPLPFVLDGWTSSGLGYEYDGYLTRAGVSIEAIDGSGPVNEISR